MNENRRRLDFSKISGRISKNISTDSSLRDITPMNWSEKVISGEKSVTIKKAK